MTRTVTAATRLAAVIGDPVRHSLSPVLYNAAFESTGIDWVYVALEVPRGSGAHAVRSMRTLGISGLSVTMPHKFDVIESCDELTPEAAALSSVNHLRVEDGKIIGDSTDGAGFLRSLADANVDVAGMKVLLLGAGGAARAVAAALSQSGASVTCAARNATTATEVAQICGGATAEFESAADLVADHDMIVNATSIGMQVDGSSGSRVSPVRAETLRKDLVVVDLVYHPVETELLGSARAVRAVVVDGLGMLIHQAGIQFEHWTGVNAPIAIMRSAALMYLG